MQLKGKRQTQQRLPKCLTGIVVLYVGCFALLHRNPPTEEAKPSTAPIEKEEPPGFVRAFLERRADWHDLMKTLGGPSADVEAFARGAPPPL